MSVNNNTELVGITSMTIADLKKELLNHQDDEKISVLFHKNNGIRNFSNKFTPIAAILQRAGVKNPGYPTTFSSTCQVRPHIYRLSRYGVKKQGNLQLRLKINGRRGSIS